MPDWLRTTVWIVGALALLLTLLISYLVWRYRIPPRGVFAMGAAAIYLISPIDLVPEAIFGPLGLVDDAGVLAAVALFVYKLVKARRILADGGIELRRRRSG
ncbi:MAG TPA: YkvA family protein [Pseudonocardia sp.]